MCTATWLWEREGYYLFFNRDEKLSRAAAAPPRICTLGGTRVLAPRDRAAGGTWIGANEHGVSVCLLNLYPESAKTNLKSRGAIVREALPARTKWGAIERALEFDARDFPPFVLLAMDLRHAPSLLISNGTSFVVREAVENDLPLTSSSLCDAAARSARRSHFESLSLRTPSALEGFHRDHRPARGPLSPCMHRDEAQTVSFTRIHVTPHGVRMAYHGGPPCSDSSCSNTCSLHWPPSAVKTSRPSARACSLPSAASA